MESNKTPKRKPLTAVIRDFLARPTAPETNAQRNLLQYYASRASKDGRCNPGYERISHDTGVQRTTIDKSNTHFKSLQVLDWKKGWGNRATGKTGQSNLYNLNPVALTARTFQAYFLGLIVLMAFYKVALPFSQVSTTTLESSTTTFEPSTTTLLSSTTTVVVPKVQAFEVSSIEEQAGKGISKPNPTPFFEEKQKPSGMSNQDKDSLLKRASVLAITLSGMALADAVIFNDKHVARLSELLKVASEQEAIHAFKHFLGNQDDFTVKNAAKNFSEGALQLIQAQRIEFARQRREKEAMEAQSRKRAQEIQERIAREQAESEADEDWDPFSESPTAELAAA